MDTRCGTWPVDRPSTGQTIAARCVATLDLHTLPATFLFCSRHVPTITAYTTLGPSAKGNRQPTTPHLLGTESEELCCNSS